MKIMSFNIQHGVIYDDPEKRIDLVQFADFINDESPDIIGLNEVRGLKEGVKEPENINADRTSQAKHIAALTGMKYVFAPALFGESGLYGNALLTRYDIIESSVIPLPRPEESLRVYGNRYEDRCLLRAVLDTGGERVTVFVCHMGLQADERVRAVAVICRELDRTDGKVILMGDFNMVPENEIIAPLFARLSDTAVKIEGNILTFPSDVPRRKIDYIFVSKEIEVLSAYIPDRYVSDHRVHIAEI